MPQAKQIKPCKKLVWRLAIAYTSRRELS